MEEFKTDYEKSNNNLKLVIGILSILLIVAVGYVVYDKVLSKEDNSNDIVNNSAEEKTNVTTEQNNTKEDLNIITSLSQFPIDDDTEGENNVLLHSTFGNIVGRLVHLRQNMEKKGDIHEFTKNGVVYTGICDNVLTSEDGFDYCTMTLKINDNTIYTGQSDNPLVISTTDHIIIRTEIDDGNISRVYIINNEGKVLKK